MTKKESKVLNKDDYLASLLADDYKSNRIDDLLNNDVKKGKKYIKVDGINEIDISNIVPFKDHPFRLYTGERLADMTKSIDANGVLTPIIVRKQANGTFECLSGHNRYNVCTILGIETIQALVKENISDKEALTYVVETNLMQRSFTDMLPSEKALVIFIRQEKLLDERQKEETGNDFLLAIEKGNDFPQAETRDKNGQEYSLSGRMVSNYLRIYKLNRYFKDLLDDRAITLMIGVELSYLTPDELETLEKVLLENEWSIDINKAKMLREVSKNKELNEQMAIDIISGEINKKKGTLSQVWQMNKKLSKKLYNRYFIGYKLDAIDETIEEAIEYFFENKID